MNDMPIKIETGPYEHNADGIWGTSSVGIKRDVYSSLLTTELSVSAGSAAVKIHPAGAVLQRHRRYGGFGKRRLSGLLIFHCQRLCRQQRPPDRCFDSGLLRFPDHHIRVSGGFDRVGSPFVPRQVKMEITVGVIGHVLPGHNKAHGTQDNEDQQDGQENLPLPASPAIATVSSGA